MSLRKLRDSVETLRCGAIVGVPLSELQSDINCLPCSKEHMVRTPYKKLELPDDYKPGERWHIDVAHGGKVTGHDGSNSILVCKDDATGYKILYTISSKTQVPDCTATLVEWVYTQRNIKVKALMTDRGTENVNAKIKNLCKTRGIEHHLSAPDHPQSNGVVERENRTTQEYVQILLESAGLPPDMWPLATEFYCHVYNLVICRRSKDKSPYEAFWGKKPRDVAYLIPFGTKVICYDEQASDKLDTRGKEGTFLGYDRYTTKVVLVLTQRRSIKRTRHIKVIRNTEVLSPSQETLKRQAYGIANVQLKRAHSADEAESDDNDDEFPPHAPPSRQESCAKKVKTEYLSLREAASSSASPSSSASDSNGPVQSDSDASTPRKKSKKSTRAVNNTESVVVPSTITDTEMQCTDDSDASTEIILVPSPPRRSKRIKQKEKLTKDPGIQNPENFQPITYGPNMPRFTCDNASNADIFANDTILPSTSQSLDTDPSGILKEPVAGTSRKRGRPPKQKNTANKGVKFEDVYTPPQAPASVPSEDTSDFTDTGETSSDEQPVVRKKIGRKGYKAVPCPP